MMIEEAARFGLAWYWGRSSDISQRIRGAELVPGNADAWHHLGQSLQYNLDEIDPSVAIAYYLRAVKADPRSADNWMDLGDAYEAKGDAEAARAADENARRAYPISAKVAWNYGNFLLRQGPADQGLEEIHRAILTDPALTPWALTDVWRFSPDANLILKRLLPADTNGYWQALDFFTSIHQADAGLAAWENLVAHSGSRPLELRRAFPFLDELIAQGRADDVENVWREALAASHWPEEAPSEPSAIWNGGFEAEIADGGLDWRIAQSPGAFVNLDSSVTHSGARSLRVDFTGGMNLDYAGLHELVSVHPGGVYEFQAFLRTESITTESGMRFEIVDPQHPQDGNFLTPALTGTNPWTAVRATIQTLPETRFLDVKLRRLPSRLFDNKLGGTVWVDDVTLIPLTGETKKAAP
jgi:tetratricopeptide (TPR) repeat protein